MLFLVFAMSYYCVDCLLLSLMLLQFVVVRCCALLFVVAYCLLGGARWSCAVLVCVVVCNCCL